MARHGPIPTRYTPVRLAEWDREWYAKLAKTTGRTLSDVIRDALTAYRALMQLPGIAFVRPIQELNTELIQAYREGIPIADLPNNDAPKPKRTRK